MVFELFEERVDGDGEVDGVGANPSQTSWVWCISAKTMPCLFVGIGGADGGVSAWSEEGGEPGM